MHPRDPAGGRAPARSAAWRWSRAVTADSGPNAELRRDDAAFLDRRWRSPCRSFVLAMGGTFPALGLHRSRARRRSGPVRAGDAGGAVGRLAVLRARLGFAGRPQPQYVHADRARRRRRLSLQRRRDLRARRLFPPAFRGADGVGRRSISRPRRSITVLVLLGQVLELRARERTGGAIRALLDLAPKTARRLGTTATDEDVPLDAGRSRRPPARAARREACRSTASCSRAAARSMNRWSPASRCRSKRQPATR